MPFKSKAQARFLFSQHPRMAKEWAAKTKSIKALPNYMNPHHSHPYSKNPGSSRCIICGMPKSEHEIS